MNVTAHIRARRTAGRTTCATMSLETAGPEIALADAVAGALGFQGLGDGWLAISAHDAHAIATFVLHRDLAGNAAIMREAEASELATAFLDLAPEPHSYFTNGEWTAALSSADATANSVAWDPISDATFDAGIICLGDGMAAMLWVEDED